MAALIGLQRTAGLALTLTAWVWDQPWPDVIQELFPVPPDAILQVSQRVVWGEGVQKIPHVWRDVSNHNLLGLLKYMQLILFGDPDTRRALSLQDKAQFYVRRPWHLLRSHGPTLWRLVRGDRRMRDAWRTQRQLQTWIKEER